MDDQESDAPIPTIALLGYFSTILAGEILVGTVLLRFLRAEPLPLYVDLSLIGLAGLFTAFGWFRKADFHRWGWTGGRIRITAFQGLAIAVLIIGLGCLFVFAIAQ